MFEFTSGVAVGVDEAGNNLYTTRVVLIPATYPGAIGVRHFEVLTVYPVGP